jgi:serine phosphatase RsbU (regulator of sigma subunit)
MKKLFILLFIFSPIFIIAQTIKLDSLLAKLNRPDDTIKIKTLVKAYEYYENSKITEGKKYLDEAFEIAQRLNNIRWESNVNMKYGNYYNILGEFEKSLQYFNRAKSIFEKNNWMVGLASTCNNIGVTYEKMGKYDNAMESYIEALSIYDTINDSMALAKTYLNLGLLHFRQNDYQKCNELYNKSLEIRIRLDDKAGIALVYNNLGILNYYMEDYDNVTQYFEMAYKIYKDLGHMRQEAMALANLAEILNIIGQKDKSLKYYFEALNIERELENKNEQISTLVLISEVYLSRNDYQNALKYAQEALVLAKETNAFPGLSSSYNLLYRIQKELKNDAEALSNHELYKLYDDSLFSESKMKQLTELQTRYETKKKEQQIDNLESEKLINELKIKRQRNFSFTLMLGFVLIFLFLMVLFRQIKKIRLANHLLAYQKKQITDSIEYASRIQSAVLPPADFISGIIPEHFIFYKPLDIVSGDFYWISEKDGKTIIAAVDCTGHGVPGAFMSMLGFAFMNEIVNKEKNLVPNVILNQLREYVKESLHQTGKENETKDGMDIALCIIDKKNNTLQFSGAYNSLLLFRGSEIITLKADRMPIGIHLSEKMSFTNHEMEIKPGDSIYIFTDGFIDQFGGKDGRRFKINAFKELLMSIQKFNMNDQKKAIERKYFEWKGNFDQIDDILIVGVRL